MKAAQTTFSMHPNVAIEGLMHGSPRRTKDGTLAERVQISTTTVTAGSETTDLVGTFTDLQTGTVYEVTAAGSATEATLLANWQAAFAAHPKLPDLFDDSSSIPASDIVIVSTAKHANRQYTIAFTGGTAVADPVTATTQVAGGADVRFGKFLVRTGNESRRMVPEVDEPTISSVLRDVAGMLPRTDGNHFHSLENDGPTDVDACPRGKTYSLAEAGETWVLPEDVVSSLSSDVYIRRAGANPGAVRTTPDGTGAEYDVTPAANALIYGFEFGFRGRHYSAQYVPTDGTTSVEDAVDGLFDAIGLVSGLTISETATELTIACDVDGEDLDYIRNTAFSLDTEAASTVVTEETAAVEQAMDASSKARWLTTTTAVGQLALLSYDFR